MEELTRQQEFNITKFSMTGVINQMQSKVNLASKQVQDATTFEDLEKAKALLEIAINEYAINVSKIIIPSQNKTK